MFAAARPSPVALRNQVIKAARGGVRMPTIAYLAVSSGGRTDRAAIHLREAAVPGLRKLTEAVHDAGAAVSCQLGHAGPAENGRSNKAQALSAWRMPSTLSLQMVRTVRDEVGDGRCRDATGQRRPGGRRGRTRTTDHDEPAAGDRARSGQSTA